MRDEDILVRPDEIKAALNKSADWLKRHGRNTNDVIGENCKEAVVLIEALQSELEAVKRERDAYKDTTLTPEQVRRCLDFEDICGEEYIDFDRLRELAKADKEGRCVVQEKTCDTCVYGDELKTEQPCCGCVDFCNWEAGEA